MQAKAQVKNVRIAPRKMRLIANMVRGKSVQTALDELKFASKRGVIVIEKLLKSAKANAVNNHNMNGDNLVIQEIYVDEGMPLKRIMPRARGKADRFMKKSSHATVIVAEA